MVTLKQWHKKVQEVIGKENLEMHYKDIIFEIIKKSIFALPELNFSSECITFVWRESKLYLDMRILPKSKLFDWVYEDNRGTKSIVVSDVSEIISLKFWEYLQELNDLAAVG